MFHVLLVLPFIIAPLIEIFFFGIIILILAGLIQFRVTSCRKKWVHLFPSVFGAFGFLAVAVWLIRTGKPAFLLLNLFIYGMIYYIVMGIFYWKGCQKEKMQEQDKKMQNVGTRTPPFR